MNIEKNTQLIARFHTEANGTGLNIYNPYFQEQHINAVYLLFQNANPKPLVEGIRNLNIAGAITAGFEHDPSLPNLVDECSEAVKISGRVGIITNKKGKLRAHYQAGEGLLAALQERVDISAKRIVIVGAGTVGKTLVLALENADTKPAELIILNRTIKHAQEVKERFPLVTSVHSFDQLSEVEGDILINATRIGSKAEDSIFTSDIVNKFDVVADVTFGREKTNLIAHAQSQKKIVVSGWDMFTYQASVVLREMLGHHANIERLRYFVRKGLAQTNHGATPDKK